MANKGKQQIFFKRKEKMPVYELVSVVEQKDELPLAVQEAIKTRIRKEHRSIYLNTPSREIKKWFVTQKI